MASGVTDLALAALGRSSSATISFVHSASCISCRIDDREILLKLSKAASISRFPARGTKRIADLAAGMVLKPGHDWFFPYYRDRALCLTLGVTTEDMLLQSVGAEADRASGGRQMPSHWSSPSLHVVSPSSATGTQFLPAVGCADATRRLDANSNAITVAFTGEGATSEGEFWEAINVSCIERLAILFLVEDNGYAIVPVEK